MSRGVLKIRIRRRESGIKTKTNEKTPIFTHVFVSQNQEARIRNLDKRLIEIPMCFPENKEQGLKKELQNTYVFR